MSWLRRLLGADRGTTPNVARLSFGSVADFVRFYQQFGFFAGSDAAILGPQLFEEYRRGPGGGGPPDLSNPWTDFEFLSHDRSRVWCEDPEADVGEGSTVYESILPEWAAVSMGIFQPEEIKESWDGPRGPLTVSFRLNGQLETIHPVFRNDWIDLTVLEQISALLGAQERAFEYAQTGNVAYVFTLCSGERDEIIKQRNLPLRTTDWSWLPGRPGSS